MMETEETQVKPDDCYRVYGQETIRCQVAPVYGESESSIYAPTIGNMRRTGLCIYCDAPIYAKDGLSFPDTILGDKWHAVNGGVRKIRA